MSHFWRQSLLMRHQLELWIYLECKFDRLVMCSMSCCMDERLFAPFHAQMDGEYVAMHRSWEGVVRWLHVVFHDVGAPCHTPFGFLCWHRHVQTWVVFLSYYLQVCTWQRNSNQLIFIYLLHLAVCFSLLLVCIWQWNSTQLFIANRSLLFTFAGCLVCNRSHWSLFVLYVNKDKRVLRLRRKKNYLLYLDSLGLTDPKECLESLYRYTYKTSVFVNM